MSKSLYREYAWQRRQQDIVSAAGRLMREKGYDSLTMDELAKELDISKPTLYQHFKTKDELVTQVLIQAMETLDEHLSKPQDGTPLETLVKVMRMVMENQYGPDTVLGAIGPEIIRALIHTSPAVKEHKQRMMEQLNRLVDEAKAKGEINELYPSGIVVRMMFCFLGLPPTADIVANSAFDFGANHQNAIECTLFAFMGAVTYKLTNSQKREITTS